MVLVDIARLPGGAPCTRVAVDYQYPCPSLSATSNTGFFAIFEGESPLPTRDRRPRPKRDDGGSNSDDDAGCAPQITTQFLFPVLYNFNF